MASFIEISGRRIGPAYPVYIVAEMSANHNQDFDKAVKIIEAAKAAGADAVKLQTYTPDTMTIDIDSELFRHGKGSLWAGRTLYDLYAEAHTPWEWQPELKKIANNLGRIHGPYRQADYHLHWHGNLSRGRGGGAGSS